MTQRLNVAVLYGGRSVEHEISIRSATNVVANINPDLFDVTLIGIDKKGSWYLNDSVADDIASGDEVMITLDASSPRLKNINTEAEIDIDVVFPVLHGTDGEDGSIQGFFTAMNLPVVGSGVLGSAISMDKIISKKVLNEEGIPVAAYIEFHKSEIEDITFSAIVDQLGLPFMIKSAALGSSVGISMVKNEGDFGSSLKDSFRYGDKVIIERFIKGRELECAIIGNENPKASLPGEIVMVKDYDFYTYEAKYLDEEAIKIMIPAELDGAITEKIRKTSIAAYQALRCEDYARIDLFLTDEGEIIINEINTIPGFTNASMFPMMWKHMGMSFMELVTALIHLCLERTKASKLHETSYNTGN